MFKFDASYRGLLHLAVTVIAVAMVLYHMWIIAFGAPEAILFRGTHLLFALTLVFLIHRRSGAAADRPPTLLDYALLVLGAAPILYLFFNYDYVVNRIYYIDDLTPADMIFGTILVAIVLEATRRVIGLPLPLTALVFLAYGLWVTAPRRRGERDENQRKGASLPPTAPQVS